LYVGLLGILASEVNKRAFLSALWDSDFNAVVNAFTEKGGKGLAIIEVDGDKNRAGYVMLIDVKLLEEGGEEVSGVKRCA